MVNYVIACYSLLLLIIFSVSEVNRVINENLYAHICILYMCRKCNHTLSWIYIKLLSHGTSLLFSYCGVYVCLRWRCVVRWLSTLTQYVIKKHI